MRHLSMLVMVLLSGLAMVAKPIVAQQLVTAQSSSTANSASKDRLVTVDFRGTPLLDALKEIEKQSGIALIYSRQTMPVNARVSYSKSGVKATDAIQQVVAGLGVVITPLANGALQLKQGAKLSQGVITGKVIDAKTSKGISGASVSIALDNRGAMTDENGLYRVTGISIGTHAITVRLVGYAKQVRSVTVGQSATVTADFRLEPSASVLDQVVVTGTITQTELKAVPNAITVVTAKQIEERGITRIDQLFRGDIPGLFSMNLGSNTPLDDVIMFSRGATALSNESIGADEGTNPIKTYIDGVEMADPQYLSQIDPKSIERIEILTGPQASTIYGANAINGVMQIFTKRGMSNRPRFSLSLNSGVTQNSFSSHLAPSHMMDIGATGIEGRVSYSIGSSWSYSGSWTPGKQTQRLSYHGGARAEWGKFSADVSARRGITQNRQNGDVGQRNIAFRASGIWSPNASAGLPQPTFQSLHGRTFGFSLSHRPYSWWSHEVVLDSDASATEWLETAPGFTFLSDTTLAISPTPSPPC